MSRTTMAMDRTEAILASEGCVAAADLHLTGGQWGTLHRDTETIPKQIDGRIEE